jgi:hypothetical protein
MTEIRQMISTYSLDNGARFKDEKGNIYVVVNRKLIKEISNG